MIENNDQCTCDEMDPDDEHPCPFAEDVNDDHENMCACCPYCEERCADDI
jgi:hypothetical protein